MEVRKRLEALGIDVKTIRKLFSLASTIAHVGNPYDQLQVQWERGSDGKLLFGGAARPDVQEAMLEDIVRAAFRFVKFEDDYVVPDVDGLAGTTT